MNKDCKNIIEAGITAEEVNEILDGVNLDTYLSDFTSQDVRFYHLGNLALLRNEFQLADYFREKSGLTIVDWCD